MLVVGAMLARRSVVGSVDDALWRESMAYSLLQASAPHQSWLDQRDPTNRPGGFSPALVIEHTDTHVELVLSRAERHNAFSSQMRDELADALGGLRSAVDSPIVIRGEGPSFCSGGDLAEFGTVGDVVAGHLVRIGRAPARLIDQMRDRIVVGLHGVCVGAGIELAAFARWIVAADDSMIWLPEVSMGLIPGAGGTVSIARRAGSHRLVELMVTGRRVDAETARSWGLVDEVVPRGALERTVRRRAAEGARGPDAGRLGRG